MDRDGMQVEIRNGGVFEEFHDAAEIGMRTGKIRQSIVHHPNVSLEAEERLHGRKRVRVASPTALWSGKKQE